MKRLIFTAALAAALTASAQRPQRPAVLSAEASTINTEALQQTSTILTRHILQGYNSICLPYSLSVEEFQQNFGSDSRLEKPVGAATEAGEFTLLFADCTHEGITAGQPYLLYSAKARYVTIKKEAAPTTAAPAAVTMADTKGNVATFRGSFERQSPIGTWAIPAVAGEIPANLICCDGTRTLNPTRCFFTWDSQADASTIAIQHLPAGTLPTAIQQVGTTTSEAAFNTAGQRTKQPHGLTIQNGKKVVK